MNLTLLAELIVSGSRQTYQNLDYAQVFDLVAAQVEVRQVWTFFHQCIQAAGDGVVAHLQLIKKKKFDLQSSE